MKSTANRNVIKFGISILNTLEVQRYVCCDCGFSKEWIDFDDIPKLRKSLKTSPKNIF